MNSSQSGRPDLFIGADFLLETPAARPTVISTPQPTATSPASPLPTPTENTAPPSVTQPEATPTSARVFIPSMSGEPSKSKSDNPASPPSLDRYTGFAGVLAALGLVALTIWRRRKGI